MFGAEDFPNTATYWAPVTPDGYGGYTYTRSEISCRWEEKAEQYTDPVGEIKISSAIVYLPSDVVLDGYLYLGSSALANPDEQTGAYVIKQFHKIPDLRAVQHERRAYL